MSIDELYKILLSDKPSKQLIKRERELFELIPELEECKGFNQNSDWHIYDVYEHILHVIDYVPNNLSLRLAALFHDLGKPKTYKEDENGIGHFYGHWEISKEIFERFAEEYNINQQLATLVSNIIYYHDLNIDKRSEEEKDKIYDLFGKEGIILLYQFKKADLLAQNKKYHYILDDLDKQKEKILNK